VNPIAGSALTHGFQIVFYVFAAVSALAAFMFAALLESKTAQSQVTPGAELTLEPGAA
jgi:hypothetical protein